MTMSETVTETVICPKCEAEVRPGSVFCYNCGGPVADSGSNSEVPETPHTEDKLTQPTPGLRTARDIRRREKAFDRSPKRVKWEPLAERSDWQLLVVTGLIVLFTLIVVALAFYLR